MRCKVRRQVIKTFKRQSRCYISWQGPNSTSSQDRIKRRLETRLRCSNQSGKTTKSQKEPAVATAQPEWVMREVSVRTQNINSDTARRNRGSDSSGVVDAGDSPIQWVLYTMRALQRGAL